MFCVLDVSDQSLMRRALVRLCPFYQIKTAFEKSDAGVVKGVCKTFPWNRLDFSMYLFSSSSEGSIKPLLEGRTTFEDRRQ